LQYAVGRIHFGTVEEYARYAEAVVRAEISGTTRPLRAAFINPVHPHDQPTRLLADRLTRPLAERVAAYLPAWEVSCDIGEAATKALFQERLLGAGSPPFVFTASHGLGYSSVETLRQRSNQGALVCQDWRGPGRGREPLRSEECFSADDVGDEADLVGRIAIHYASFAAGTSQPQDQARPAYDPSTAAVPKSFVSKLAQRLLGHPRGGMLAVLGLFERSWGYSYPWPQTEEHLESILGMVFRLLYGFPVGAAMEYLNQHYYAALYSNLSAELEDVRFGETVDDTVLAGLWAIGSDCRSFVIVGDPAVRLATASPATEGASGTAGVVD
jgi:hypothetical protein